MKKKWTDLKNINSINSIPRNRCNYLPTYIQYVTYDVAKLVKFKNKNKMLYKIVARIF